MLTAGHFPYQDGPNHLARYVLLDRAWWGTVPAEVHARLLPTPYIGLDLIGAALVHVLGPDLALRAIMLLAVLLLPLGMERLLRHTAPHRRGWALAGVLFSLNWYLLDGLLNFVVGAGLVFCWLAWWWPRRDGDALGPRVALAAGAAGLFLVHLSAPLSALVVVWIDWGLAALAWLRAPRADRLLLRVRARALTMLAVTGAVFALWAVAESTLGRSPSGADALEFRSAALKVAALGAPFYAFDARQALVLAVGWLVSLGVFLVVNRADLRIDTITASAAAFLVLYLV
ncbi:MAG: hypothetical protein M3154_02325, partial [Candidatus Eremiobacteraeota bacterium]|nr:hypothetical protein [Candidatus Eremiobacteraeota bacterium]